MISHTQDTLRLAGPEDMEQVRAILEDPSVAGTFGPVPMDLEAFAVFMFPGGVYGAEVRANHDVYLHLAVLPWARGPRAIQAMKTLRDWFFRNTPAQRVCGWTPTDRRANRMFNMLVGGRRRGEAQGKTLYAITRSEWEQQHG